MTDDAQPKAPHNPSPYARHDEPGTFDPKTGQWTRGRYVGTGRTEGHAEDCGCKFCKQFRTLTKGRIKQAENRAAGIKPKRYDYKAAEDMFFNQTKPDGSFYSMKEIAETIGIPLDRLYMRSGKRTNSMGERETWPEARKKLIEGPIKAQQAIAERNAARLAANAIAAERRLHEKPTASSELQRLQQATLALFEKYVNAIESAEDVKAATFARALGELYKQALALSQRAPDTGQADLQEWETMKTQIEEALAR